MHVVDREGDDHPFCGRPSPDAIRGCLSKVIHRMAHLCSQTGYGSSPLVRKSWPNPHLPDEIFTEFFSNLPPEASLLQGQSVQQANQRSTILQQRIRNKTPCITRLHSAVPFHEAEVSSVTVGTCAVSVRSLTWNATSWRRGYVSSKHFLP